MLWGGQIMPKRKKLPRIPDYVGMGDPEKLTVQKSNPLQTLSQTELSLPAFKLLDVYLSRIDSHDPDKRTVQLEKGELEQLLGVTKISQKDLDERLRQLFQVVKVFDSSKRGGFKLISLFEEAYADPDEDGLWQITLTCTASAREYIFNVDNIGYLKYRLKNVIELTSRYSYVLYIYLENNRFRRSWEIDLNELKKLLNCTATTYNTFKYFNDLVLKKCLVEITEKTNCKFSYETVKKGRTVKAIRFTVESLNEPISVDAEEVPIQLLEGPEENYIHFLSEACDESFTDKQMEVLASMVDRLQLSPYPDGLDCNKYQYLRGKYKLLELQETEKTIKNRFSYLKKIIEQDLI